MTLSLHLALYTLLVERILPCVSRLPGCLDNLAVSALEPRAVSISPSKRSRQKLCNGVGYRYLWPQVAGTETTSMCMLPLS